jgi:hypothetical protein
LKAESSRSGGPTGSASDEGSLNYTTTWQRIRKRNGHIRRDHVTRQEARETQESGLVLCNNLLSKELTHSTRLASISSNENVSSDLRAFH